MFLCCISPADTAYWFVGGELLGFIFNKINSLYKINVTYKESQVK